MLKKCIIFNLERKLMKHFYERFYEYRCVITAYKETF